MRIRTFPLLAFTALAVTCPAAAQTSFPSLLSYEKFVGGGHWDGMGMTCLWLDDLNGDSIPEFASSAFCTDFAGFNSGSMYIFDGATKTIMRRHDGLVATARFGDAAAVCGDVDGDGVGDYVVGASRDLYQGDAVGSATVFSGATGLQLHYLRGEYDGDRFGIEVCAAGDVNGDGRQDLLVGAPLAAGGTGRAHVYDGLTGTLIRTHSGNGLEMACGGAVRGLGDVNGDGISDYAIARPGAGQQVGHVTLYSGYDGLPIHNWTGTAPEGRFGNSVDPAGDVDADGIPDLIIGEPCADAFHIYSGATGALIRSHFGALPSGKTGFGHAAATIGDWDGDSVDDYMLGAPGEWDHVDFFSITPGGAVHLISGATGVAIDVIVCPSPFIAFGWSLAGAKDLDGDGNPDLLIGAPAYGISTGGTAPGAMILGYGAP